MLLKDTFKSVELTGSQYLIYSKNRKTAGLRVKIILFEARKIDT